MSVETEQAIWDAIGEKIEHGDTCERGCECRTSQELDECLRFDAAISAAIDRHVDGKLTALRQQVTDLRAALAPFAEEVAGGNLRCHRGICPPDECVRCRRILMAQRVLAATQPQEVQR